MHITAPHERARNSVVASMRMALSGERTYRPGRLPVAWRSFQREKEIKWVFKHFYCNSLVQLEFDPDDLSFDDLHGDCYDLSIDHGINPSLVAKQRKEAERRLERDGQWIVSAQYNMGNAAGGEPEWCTTDSIGGFVGGDFNGSGYEPQLHIAALEGLFEHYGGELPDYVSSKTGDWANAVLMGWEIIRGAKP